jgi:ParB-like chromosome segregation protein Spo0J
MSVTLDEQTENGPIDVEPRLLGIQIEAKLRDWKIPYEYVAEYPLADVKNVDWTQVREDEHLEDKETLAEFRTQMSQGTVYPPIVIMDPDVLVDGNHRVRAAKGLRRKAFPAFVARFNSVDLAKTFAAAMNQQNGRRLTPAEAYQAALTMMRRGMADEAVAREIGRSVEAVRQMRRRKEFAERSAQLPEIADVADQVRQTQQVKLAQIKHDPAFVEAVKVVAETKPKEGVVSDIVKAVSQARTDSEAVAAVRAIRDELAPAGPPPRRIIVSSEVRQARAHLGGLLKYAETPAVLLDVVTPEARQAAVERWTKTRDLANQILDLYNRDERN